MLFSRFLRSIDCNRRSLRIETLESRHLLSASACSLGSLGPVAPTSYSFGGSCQEVPTGLEPFFDSQSVGSATEAPFAGAPYDVEFIHWNGRRSAVVAGQWIVRLKDNPIEPRGTTDDVTFLRSLTTSEASDLWLVETAPGLQPYQVAHAIGQAEVEFVEPNFAVVSTALPDDPQFDQLWGLANFGQTGGTAGADVDAIEAWNRTTGSDDLVIAAFDSGIDYAHPDLADNIWRNPREVADNGVDDDGNGFIDDVFGVDVVFDDGDPADIDGHGTHTAGTLGAVGNNDIGVAGVAWDVQIMPIKFLSDSGFGSNDKAILGMNYMLMMRRDFGINIVASNHSWSGADYSQVLDDLIAEGIDLGITFVASAGNDAINNDLSPTYPAAYDHEGLITVAATDANDELADFSRYGASTVDLAAPGVGILSTTPGGEYGLSDGTSMSAPYVTGTVALLKSLYPGAGPSQIKSAILSGVDLLPSLAGKTVSGGRLNILGAIESMGFFVNKSTPSDVQSGVSIQEPPTEFVIELSHDLSPQAVSASGFEVNGQIADSVTVLSGNTLRFEFVASPVVQQGLQEMSLAAASVQRESDGLPNDRFDATFRYDQRLLSGRVRSSLNNVDSQRPTIDISFNEPIDPSTLEVGDFWVSHGTLLTAELVSPVVARFTMGAFDSDADRVQFRLFAGSVSDLHGGSSVTDLEGEFGLDIDSIDFPGDWELLEPQSSLAAARMTVGNISHRTDRDVYRVFLNAGQRLSIATDGPIFTLSSDTDEGLADLVHVDDSDNRWGTHLVETTGVYRIGVVSNGGTTGRYELRILVNAMFEEGVGDNEKKDDATLINDYEISRGTTKQATFVGGLPGVHHFEIDLMEKRFALHPSPYWVRQRCLL